MDGRNQNTPATLPGLGDEELSGALYATTFVVVDLETTGLNPTESTIIEIGAVKVRGGVTLETFHSLVDPLQPLSPTIIGITGITDADLHGQPTLDTVVPAFMDFAQGSVLVAHNASFDLGFLAAAAAELGLIWGRPEHICTLRLARRLVTREEVGSYRLGDLARFFDASQTPSHRALDDARATVDVLHGLIERAGSANLTTVAALQKTATKKLPAVLAAKRGLTDALPHQPGIYIFRNAQGHPLYIGTAADLKRRVQSYFTGSDPRRRILEMITLATQIDHSVCAHELDAQLRESHLIATWKPPYNRRSRNPHRGWWLVPPRARTGTGYRAARQPTGPGSVGPFRTRTEVTQAAQLLGLDTATALSGEEIIADLFTGDAAPITAAIVALTKTAAEGRFAAAAAQRDSLIDLLTVLLRQQRLSHIAACPRLQAAWPDHSGGWNLLAVDYGTVRAAVHAPSGVNIAHLIDQATATELVPAAADAGPLRGHPVEHLAIIARWITRDDCRIAGGSGPWRHPEIGVGAFATWLEQARLAQQTPG